MDGTMHSVSSKNILVKSGSTKGYQSVVSQQTVINETTIQTFM